MSGDITITGGQSEYRFCADHDLREEVAGRTWVLADLMGMADLLKTLADLAKLPLKAQAAGKQSKSFDQLEPLFEWDCSIAVSGAIAGGWRLVAA